MLGAASFGDWIGLLATGLFASAQFSNSAAQGAAFGGTIAVRLLPALLLGPIAGVFADRFDRRYTMVITDLIRFVFYGSIPVVALVGASPALVVTWATIATFVGETITLIWIPAKEAAVPNLLQHKSQIEVSNQLTLVTTYGITPILAALGLSALTAGVQHSGVALPDWAQPVQLALYLNALSRLATALVVFFGIREIGGKSAERQQAAEQSMFHQFLDGWKYIGRTPLVRGLVLGIFGAFAAGGVVIGAARTYATSLGAGEAAFYLLFGTIFLGLAVGIGLGPMIVKELSRRRWFGMNIVLASGSVMFLGLAFHLSMALVGALLVGAGAGMAFLAGTTLLYGEVDDAVRGRVFAVVQIGVRMVLLLAITLAGLLVGLGSSRRLDLGVASVDVSSTRVLLLVAGAVGIWVGIGSFRQMDDKKGVPILADLIGSVRGRPLAPPEEFVRTGVFVVFEGGEGAGKSTQVTRLADKLLAEGRDVVVTREPGATDLGGRIRGLVLDHSEDGPSPRAEALLYAADRAHHVATLVRPALARGAVVISDRYVDSSLAYQGAGRTLPVQEISWLSSWATGGLKPDLVVLLDVDPGVGLGRVGARGAGADRLESESKAFHERVRYAFLDLAAADPKRYLVLDAARPTDEIAAAVAARLADLVGEPPTPAPSAPATSGSSASPSPEASASGSPAAPSPETSGPVAPPSASGSPSAPGSSSKSSPSALEEMAEVLDLDETPKS
ncbi:dTMP kinase [Actinoplanes siamensis]|uniref:Thymidylate kinase n=1 Tax=Actinoplanes siamensis TaxID=1223317 RepID=A0A919N6L8_9ACTN|nr:dTMP kinase [Actinoplanes siamensis]GIF05310.1 dTMP kinase [Actinoplanes siamensis]